MLTVCVKTIGSWAIYVKQISKRGDSKLNITSKNPSWLGTDQLVIYKLECM